ncbi:disulfide bond formation protein B [Streptomyces sp. PCS3-D2]|uniref:disulfide bond formation protein B n=1 Tax=Streptomyces sp. PCS3-D2 TaxID=1460244 RepID=UPI0006899A43|nr:disulfide bond formation protein B [Streptomyces sp. PCS3-D2]WKV76320.1 disulfide bond formation protein B [Streptomyces sp. PCS3-D2]
MATIETLVPETAPESPPLGKVQYWFACLFAVGWTGVVCAGLVHQFVQGEHPCPLCVVQRMFMLLAALGAAYIIRTALHRGSVTGRHYMTGWGLTLIALVGGSVAAWRQTTLHILPGDKGYGGEVFGLHLYVWALILFQASALVVGIALATAHTTADRGVPATGPGPLRTAGLFALWFLGAVIAVNLLVVFAEEGYHWFLPDDPNGYRFFSDLGMSD